MTRGGETPDARPWFIARLGLFVTCLLVAGVQLAGWLIRSPFSGLGVLAVPLLPIILAYYLVLLMAVVVGIPLAIACFMTRRPSLVAMGAVLVVLSALNTHAMVDWYLKNQARDRELARSHEA